MSGNASRGFRRGVSYIIANVEERDDYVDVTYREIKFGITDNSLEKLVKRYPRGEWKKFHPNTNDSYFHFDFTSHWNAHK